MSLDAKPLHVALIGGWASIRVLLVPSTCSILQFSQRSEKCINLFSDHVIKSMLKGVLKAFHTFPSHVVINTVSIVMLISDFQF